MKKYRNLFVFETQSHIFGQSFAILKTVYKRWLIIVFGAFYVKKNISTYCFDQKNKSTITNKHILYISHFCFFYFDAFLQSRFSFVSFKHVFFRKYVLKNHIHQQNFILLLIIQMYLLVLKIYTINKQEKIKKTQLFV